ncbi:MAG: lipoyl synthase [Aeromonas sp.]
MSPLRPALTRAQQHAIAVTLVTDDAATSAAPPATKTLAKPDWLRIKLPSDSRPIARIKQTLRAHQLHSVCEEASCPNLAECFSRGTATFMIMGAICTRHCPYCDVANGRPKPLDSEEPKHLATTLAELALNYVVITSVDRDDLRDGGASHFAACISAIRAQSPATQIEILTPDFRGRQAIALAALSHALPDVFNHNIETVPRLYTSTRPGASYQGSLDLLRAIKTAHPHLPTKSGLMLGLGETDSEVQEVLRDLRAHGVTRLTLGQYLQPSPAHLPVARFVSPAQFAALKTQALALGFTHVASNPLVRSSYHAEEQAHAPNEAIGLASPN